MKTLTYIDKTEFKGNLYKDIWLNEPDKANWIDEATGLDCMIHRGQSGALCGYVGVPESHPSFEKDYHDV